MTKKLILFLGLISLMVLTACSGGSEKKLEKARALVKDKNFKEAIEIYDGLIEENEKMFEAHKGLVRAYMKDDEYRDADDALERFFEVVKGDYEEDQTVDYEYWLREIVDAAGDMERRGERVGKWYDELNPPVVDLFDIPYDFDLETALELEVPQDMTAYYTLDGSKPTDKDTKYDGPITFSEEGEYNLSVITVNDYGIKGEPSTTYINVFTAPEAPRVNFPGGTYEGRLFVGIEDYDYDTMDVYYTTDGSDPLTNGEYYYDSEGILLMDGDYTVNIVYYDIEKGQYSRMLTEQYTINNPNALTEYTSLTVAVYGMNYDVYSEVEYALYDLYYAVDDIDITVYEAYDLESLVVDLEGGYADAVYCSAMYVEDLAEYGLLAEVESITDVDWSVYYNEAYDAGLYDGGYYTFPVTIDPDLWLYANAYDVDNLEIETWERVIEVANDRTSTYSFLYPEDYGGYWLYSYYLGHGGVWQFDENGNFILDREPLINAMQFASDITEVYGLGYKGMDYETYAAAIESSDVTLVLANPTDMYDLDMYSYYVPVGPMPMPGGLNTVSVNNVNGLHVNSLIVGDSNKEAAARMAYGILSESGYLAENSYVSDIASATDGLPAIIEEADPDLLYLKGWVPDYERAIGLNITVPYTYQLADVTLQMDYYLAEYLNGAMTIEEAADAIIVEVAAYFQ